MGILTIWGFDYNFTNYNFNKTIELNKHIEFHPYGNLSFIIFVFFS